MLSHKEAATSPEDRLKFRKNENIIESARQEISSALTNQDLSLQEREEAAILFEAANGMSKSLKALKKLILD